MLTRLINDLEEYYPEQIEDITQVYNLFKEDKNAWQKLLLFLKGRNERLLLYKKNVCGFEFTGISVSDCNTCVSIYGDDFVRLYDFERNECKDIDTGRLIYAFMDDMIYVYDGTNMKLYTKTGVELYSFEVQISEPPSSVSGKNVSLLQFEDMFILIDPVKKYHCVQKSEKIPAMMGYKAEYSVANIQGYTIIVQALRKPVNGTQKCKVMSSVMVFDSKLKKIFHRYFNRMPKTMDSVCQVSWANDVVTYNSILIQPGNGMLYSMSIDNEYIRTYVVPINAFSADKLVHSIYEVKDNNVLFVQVKDSLYLVKIDKDNVSYMSPMKIPRNMFCSMLEDNIYFTTGSSVYIIDKQLSSDILGCSILDSIYEKSYVKLYKCQDTLMLHNYDYFENHFISIPFAL